MKDLKLILSIRNLASHLSTQLDIDIIYFLDCTRAFSLWFCILPGGLSAWCLVCLPGALSACMVPCLPTWCLVCLHGALSVCMVPCLHFIKQLYSFTTFGAFDWDWCCTTIENLIFFV